MPADHSTQTFLLYRLEQQYDTQTIIKLLASLGKLAQQPLQHSQSTMKDSFDWRLYRAGYVVEEVHQDSTVHSLLRHIESEESRAYLAGKAPLVLSDDTPDPGTQWYQLIAPVMKLRALLPVLYRRSIIEEICVLNQDDKTVVRVSIEQYQVSTQAALAYQPLGRFLRVSPVRGYHKQCKRTLEKLHHSLHLQDCLQQNLYTLSLQTIGRKPMDYSSKLKINLDANMPAWLASNHIMRILLSAIEANEAGLTGDIDTEFLHDFRIAVRRTRSALTQIRPVMPPEVMEHFQLEFAWLGQLTSPPRDLDVYLLNFVRYQQALPVCMRHDLEPLRTFLKQKRKQAYQSMIWQLHSSRYLRLKKNWMAFLNSDNPINSRPKEADETISALASQRIEKLFTHVLRQGSAICPDSPPESLHALRKSCKKLRYMIEFFRSLYEKKTVCGLMVHLKLLQDNLGQFQDLAVQSTSLQEIQREMTAAGLLSQSNGCAINILVEQLHQRQAVARDTYADCFKRFYESKNRRRFCRMLRRAHP